MTDYQLLTILEQNKFMTYTYTQTFDRVFISWKNFAYTTVGFTTLSCTGSCVSLNKTVTTKLYSFTVLQCQVKWNSTTTMRGSFSLKGGSKRGIFQHISWRHAHHTKLDFRILCSVLRTTYFQNKCPWQIWFSKNIPTLFREPTY